MVLLFLQAYAMLPQLAASLLSPLQVLVVLRAPLMVVGVGFGALLQVWVGSYEQQHFAPNQEGLVVLYGVPNVCRPAIYGVGLSEVVLKPRLSLRSLLHQRAACTQVILPLVLPV